jgi:hypothetical protein
MRARELTAVTLFLAIGAAGCGGSAPGPAPAPPPAANTKPAAAPAAPGETPVENADAGYRYTVPAGWSSEQGEGYALVASPDRNVRIAILTANPGQEKDLGKAIEAEVQHVIKELKRDEKVEDRDVNGIKSATAKGTGKYEGMDVTWSANRLELKKTVFVVGFAPSKDYETQKPTIDRFVSSFKKV